MRYQTVLFTITTNYRRKKTASFDTVFLIVVGEELGSNIREPPTLWSSKLLSILYRRKKTASFDTVFLIVVGEEGFEPPTLWSQTRCATKLRYSPTLFFLRYERLNVSI